MEKIRISSEVNQKALKEEFKKSCQNPSFRKLVKTLDIDGEVAMKYTSSLENTVK